MKGFRMRTTLDIEEDVLAAAREIARRQNISAGQLISRLLREALSDRAYQNSAAHDDSALAGGFRSFPSQGILISNDKIDDLRDTEGV
jgi:predicted DNA-binding ribbon-helix-helix protein